MAFSWVYCYNLEYIPHLPNFEQVNVCLKPVSWHSIYTRAERDHPSTVVSVNFEHMAPCSSVSTVDFEHVFIFWVWSFNISIVFRLRWIQVPFIYRKDFYEVKHLHEVAYTAPCLIFFRNLFKISKLECVNSPFFRTPSINYSVVIFQDKIPLGVKSPGVNCPGGIFMGITCPGGNCQENYSGVIIHQE